MTLCRRDRSTSRLSWSSPPLRTRLRCRLGFRFGHRCRCGRCPTSTTQANPLRHGRAPLGIAWGCHRVIGRQVPPCAILLDAQPMGGRHMPAEHLPFPAAIQADDIIAVNGSPDRNRRGSLDDGFCCRLTEATESLMDGRDQDGELIRWDLIRSGDPRRRSSSRGAAWSNSRRASGSAFSFVRSPCTATEGGGCSTLPENRGGRVEIGSPFEDSPFGP